VNVTLESDRTTALRQVLQAYKSQQNTDPTAFMQELREQAQVTLPPQNRRFLNWDEAREMANAGMEIGAHTHSHPFLSRLSYEQQEFELREPKATIEKNLGLPVTSLAYPNGTLNDFNSKTQQIARNAGYTSAFSYYGGINPPVIGDPFNILRITPNALPGSFRFDSILATRFGKLEPYLRNTYRRIRYGSQAA
jgi:peptidoglycan/xylan/chitin deacetylase (PgdA/CDA1 family)